MASMPGNVTSIRCQKQAAAGECSRPGAELPFAGVLFDGSSDLVNAHRFGEAWTIADLAFMFLHLVPPDGCGEEYDWYLFQLRVFTQLGSHIPSGHARHDDIQEDDIGVEFPRGPESILAPIFHPNGVIAGILEVQLKKTREAFLVIHQQNSFFSHDCIRKV